MSTNAKELTLERGGRVVSSSSTPLDPYPEIMKGNGRARVSMSVGLSLPYGELKVTATVTLTCDQEAVAIDEAARLAYTKASELVLEGFSQAQQQMEAGKSEPK